MRPRLLLSFHGGNRAWPGIGQQLYAEAEPFREAVARCSPAAERSLGFSLSDFFAGRECAPAASPEEGERRHIVIVSAVGLALFDLWQSHGVEPEGVVGNCSGEIAAGYAAGALTLEEAAEVACSVAHLVTQKSLKGHFIWLDVNFDDALRLARAAPVRFEVVVDLSPVSSLAFCTSEEFADLQRFLSERGVGRHAAESGWAYHTPGSNALAGMAGGLYQPRPRPLARPFYSAAAGGLFPAGTLLKPDHWYRAAVGEVRFGLATCAALADGYDVILNIGGHTSVRAGVEQSAKALKTSALVLDTMRRGEPEAATWRESLRRLGESGLAGRPKGGAARARPTGGPDAADGLNLLRPDVVRDPYPHYAALRSAGPVHFLREHGFWLVLNYDDVVRALKQPQLFSSVKPAVRFDSVLTEADPPAHTRVRRILAPYFSAQGVHALEAYVRDCAAGLLRAGGRPAEFDLVRNFAEPLTELTITRLLGLSEGEAEDLRRAVGPHKHSPDGSLYTTLEAWVREYVARLRERPDESLGGQLLRGEGEASLTPEEVVTLLKLLWAAGTHTTERLISTSALLLLRHPAARAEVQGDSGLLPQFVEEALRLDTPELMAWRSAREGAEVAGVPIPAGAEVRLCLAAANHDPRQFAEPERLSLRRSPNNHLSFAAGPHYCLGAALTRMEARVALETLLAEWPDFHAARPLHTVSYVEEYHSRTLKELFVAAG